MDKNDAIKDANNTTGAGRISNPGKDVKKDEVASQDISEVDRQEGEMDHGEKGGNFNEQDAAAKK